MSLNPFSSSLFQKIEAWQLNRQRTSQLNWIDSSLSATYGGLVKLRNILYDKGVFPSYRLSCETPLISVGSVFAGGSGKTPFVRYLLKSLPLNTYVIVRRYRNCDEELLYSNPVIVSKDRLLGCEEAIQKGAECIVLDDAFQHRQLCRDRDIVVIESSQMKDHAYLLPKGLLREPIKRVSQADLLVLHRCSDQETFEEVQSLLPSHPAVIGVDYEFDGCYTLEGVEVSLPKRVYLISAIANPSSFLEQVLKLERDVVGATEKVDHAAFSHEELQALSAHAKKEKAILLCTEKDAKKIPIGFSVLYLRVKMKIFFNKNHYEQFLKTLPCFFAKEKSL